MEKYKNSYKNNNFEMSILTQNDRFELSDRSYSVSDIEDYFEYIIKKHGTITDNPPIKICIHKIESRITSKIKTGYHLKRLTYEIMKLIGSTENKIVKIKMVKMYLTFKSL